MKLELSERRERETTREYALRILSMNILRLRLVPGTALSEQEIAGELSVSRTPVREAQGQLQLAGLVTVRDEYYDLLIRRRNRAVVTPGWKLVWDVLVRGGDLILEQCRKVLQDEYPALAGSIRVMLPDEKTRRVGQSVAAASLPKLG